MFTPAIVILFSTAVIFGGSASARLQLTFQPPTLDNFAWMAGEWQMTSGAACTEERWMPPANDMLIGMSRTVQSGRTTSFEFMRIVARPDGIYFVAQAGGRPPVDFKLLAASNSEAVFVNPGHAVDYVYRPTPIRAPGTASTAACP